ncbi:MAG: hypothetical protein V4569_20375 [Pseudomonadota bacterium]
MGIPRITGTSRVSTSTADTPTPANPFAIAANSAVAAVEIDAVTLQPLPPRFPWLSRLSQQLEAAARQRPAFPPAPVLGDHIDRSV